MTELSPSLPLPVLQDPNVTRLLGRRLVPEDEQQLAEVAAPTVTSACLVVPVDGDAATAQLAGLTDWDPARLRVEVAAVTQPDSSVRRTARSILMDSGRTWRMLDHPGGGRPGAFASVAAAADAEFLVVPGPTVANPQRLSRLPVSLMAMWRDGADVAVLRAPGTPVATAVDPAAFLVGSLGMTAGGDGADVVVMRRWVARWILNECTRAIAPAEEVADRVRLLGARILVIADDVPVT